MSDRHAFELVKIYIQKYNTMPSVEALYIEADKKDDVSDEVLADIKGVIETIGGKVSKKDDKWLVDTTEEFCKGNALRIALTESIRIYGDKSGKLSKTAIPKILQDALSVSFDPSIGHDFFDDYEKRYDMYHTVEKKIPFSLSFFNKITKGGIARKTLSVVMAATGVGKTLFMIHNAASNVMAGFNVLYITLEMGEVGDPSIGERIDANILDVPIDHLLKMPKEQFVNRVKKAKERTTGKIIIKEYPTSTVGSAHFRALLNELKLKKNFIPDIIYIDYLNICTSSVLKYSSGNVNTYQYVKSISEEMRAIAVEYNVAIFSATQTNRQGMGNSDITLENTSESVGLPQTVDFMFAISQTEELVDLGQILVKQLKNRYTDTNTNSKFVVGVDKSRMRLYDCEQTAQENISGSNQDDDKPVMDKTEFGFQDENRAKTRPKFDGFR